MCDFARKPSRFKGKTATVYKFAFKEDGKYYSPATGVEWKVGKVQAVDRNLGGERVHGTSFANDIGWYNSVTFNIHMVGRTAGFKKMNDAIEARKRLVYYYHHSKFPIIKVVLTDSLVACHYGRKIIKSRYSKVSCVAGRQILSIEEIQNN